MRRRSILATVVLAASSATFALPAQQPRRIAILSAALPSSSGGTDSVVAVLKRAMRRRGYIEGESVTYDVRTRMRGDTAIIDSLARELVQSHPDVVLTLGSTEAFRVARLTPSTPIVTWSSNPVAEGLVASVSQPRSTVTGLTARRAFWPELITTWRRVVPNATRLALIYDSTYKPQHGNLPTIRGAADSLGIELRVYHARLPAEMEAALDSVAANGIQSVFLMSPSFRLTPARWTRAALDHHLIAFSTYDEVADSGGLFSCPPDFRAFAELAADYLDKILKGAQPRDLPIQQSIPHLCTLNLRSAANLQIGIPDSVRKLFARVLR